ncbi:MAG TPA: hypothetical protein PKY81_13775 [bacterium]|nr:hypothetical protein [bacterium]
MQAKFNFLSFLIILTIIVSGVSSCKNKKAGNTNVSETSQSSNPIVDVEPYDAAYLLSQGLSAVNEIETEGIPEYSYNKGLNFFYQVVTKFPETNEAVEAQFNIAKYTEKKIKLLNMREIDIRKRQSPGKTLDFDELKPFLQSYIPAINEYIKLYNNKKIWENFRGDFLKKSRRLCSDSLLQAAQLLADETNPKPDYNRAIEIYRIIIDEFSDSNYGDFSIYSIVSIYYNMKNWSKTIEYAKLMESNFPQSQYLLEVDSKAKKSRSLLK